MQEPHDLIKDFIDEKLQGNLHRLVNFDLTRLRGDRKYGSCNSSFGLSISSNRPFSMYVYFYAGINMYESEAMLITSHSITP